MLDKATEAESVGGVSRGQLRAFVERIERLEEEKAALADDIRSVYAEAKSAGFCVKTMRKIVKLRGQNDQERIEAEAILSAYMRALDMIQPDLFEQ